MTWLVVASPCALVISTPASILSAIANGACRGILFKGGVHLEQTAQLKVVAFDKTRTIITDSPTLTEVVPFAHISEDELLRLAAATGPAQSTAVHCDRSGGEARGLALPLATDFQSIPGQGVEANVDDGRSGSEMSGFQRTEGAHPQDLLQRARELEARANSDVGQCQRELAWSTGGG
jgi:Cd2+/Zn2+-exporting ATPase